MITYDSLIKDFKNLGIASGDVLFLRVSYKEIGKIEGGPKVFIDSLLSVVGDSGTLVLTAYPKRMIARFRYFRRKKIVSDKVHLPSSTGIMSIIATTYPNAVFSSHPTYPCIIIGNQADIIAAGHSYDDYPFSIMENLASHYRAKCLRIGGDVLVGTTHIALHEALLRNHYHQKVVKEGAYFQSNGNMIWRSDTSSAFCKNGYKNFFFKHVAKEAVISEGMVGNGLAMLTLMSKTLEIERRLLCNNPTHILCNDSNCFWCNATLSFHSQKWSYLLSQLRRFLLLRDKKALRNIYLLLRLMLLGENVQ